jgi:hypothetical protein
LTTALLVAVSLSVALASPESAPESAPADGAWLRALPGEGRSGCCYGLAADARGGAWFLGAFPGPGPVDVDGVPRSGRGDADALLLHLTSEGSVDRSVVIGGAGRDHATELAAGPDDSAYAVIRIGSDLRIDDAFLPVGGGAESALLRFTSAGRCTWAIPLPGTAEDGAQAIAAGKGGDVVTAGTFVRVWSRGDVPEVYAAKYGSGGEHGWQRRCEGTGRTVAVDMDDRGRVYLGVATAATDPGEGRRPADGWPLVLGFDAQGVYRWRWEPRRGEDAGEAWGRVVAVAAEPEGGCRVLGEVRGLVRIGDAADAGLRGRDLFLARLDADGRLRWIERFGGPGDDAAFDLAAGRDGACVVSGTFRGTAVLEPWTLTTGATAAGFVAEWNADGGCEWARVLEPAGANEEEILPYEIAIAADGAVWIAGWYRDSVQLAGLRLDGGRDGVFLARMLPGGTTR